MTEGSLVELAFLLTASLPRGSNRFIALFFWFANVIDRLRGTSQWLTTTQNHIKVKNPQDLTENEFQLNLLHERNEEERKVDLPAEGIGSYPTMPMIEDGPAIGL